MSISSNGLPADNRSRAVLAALAPDPPAWAVEHFADALRDRAGLDDWRLVSADIPDCASLDAPALERAVGDAYRAVAESLRASGHHPVRFWNFVPGIHADMGGGLDRYMVFNAGRYAAFEAWFGQAALFTRTVPDRLGGRDRLGIAGHPRAGRPRRRPAGREPAPGAGLPLFGALRSDPACFARGTIVRGLPAGPGDCGDGAVLLVGGTASIVGENSLHDRDARQQALETFENLAELVAAARRQIGGGAGAGHDAPRAAFDAFTELRVYVVRDSDAPLLREMVIERFGRTARIEFAQANLCRRELLVEIEGLATL